MIKHAKEVDDRVGATELIIKLKPKVVERWNFASASFGSVGKTPDFSQLFTKVRV